MKLTLLELTQNILSSLNSDQVNSIGDTPESLQVAECIRTTYINMMGKYELPEHVKLINLNPSGSDAQPVLMLRPDGIKRLEWIRYFNSNPADGNQFNDQYGAYSQHDVNVDLQNNVNGWSTTSTTSAIIDEGPQTFTVTSGLTINTNDTAYAVSGINFMSGTVTSYSGTTLVLNITKVSGSGTFATWNITEFNPFASGPGYQQVKMLTVDHFIQMVNDFNITEDDVESFTLVIPNDATNTNGSFTFYYKNDKQPQYCCMLNNYYIVFDSYDNTQDTTLQSSKTEAMAWLSPDFLMQDAFTPVLDDQQFPLLLNDAKSLAFEEIKQMPHRKAEVEFKRQEAAMQKYKSTANRPTYFNELPNFGRVGGGWY